MLKCLKKYVIVLKIGFVSFIENTEETIFF